MPNRLHSVLNWNISLLHEHVNANVTSDIHKYIMALLRGITSSAHAVRII
jgi:hypothetical protein